MSDQRNDEACRVGVAVVDSDVLSGFGNCGGKRTPGLKGQSGLCRKTPEYRHSAQKKRRDTYVSRRFCLGCCQQRLSGGREGFITLNEPQRFVGLGHLYGINVPGKKLPIKDTFQITHNALRAHGQAVINLRKYASRPIRIGYAPTCGMAYPASDAPTDIEVARKVLFSFYNPMDNWTWNVAWFSDPVFPGKYPEEGMEKI